MSESISSDSEVDSLFTGIEADYKTLIVALDTAIKGLKSLNKKVKKGEVVVKGNKLTDVLDLAVGIAKKSGKGYGTVIIEELN